MDRAYPKDWVPAVNKFQTIAVCLSIIMGACIIAWPKLSSTSTVVGDLGDRLPHPFRPPRPPQPNPEPPPADLDDNDGRLFARLRGHIEKTADERAKRHIEVFATELGDRLDGMKADGEIVIGDGEPAQFIGASFLAGAIFAVVKKVVVAIVKALIIAAIIAIFWQYWAIISVVFVGAVTVVAAPIAWAAGKITKPKE